MMWELEDRVLVYVRETKKYSRIIQKINLNGKIGVVIIKMK